MDAIRIKPELAATAGQWEYLRCQGSVNLPSPGMRGNITLECAACGNANLRFTHIRENINDEHQICVGIECARVLLGPDGWEIPGVAENEVKRKERWRIHLKRPGRCTTDIQDLINRGKL
ncbi:MAG TPA: hypothetical protein VMF56_02425 [Acidobacteriaceae bacterium]|nr:hypothetical protein [Acidobacteriaceae bacterium]